MSARRPVCAARPTGARDADADRGRVRQIGKRAAAEIRRAGTAGRARNARRLHRAEEFLEQEEIDSGIVVSRSPRWSSGT